MSKWSKWMPNIGDTGQHWDSEEIIKIRLDSGAVAKGMIESLVGIHFTHFKRLKANVEAERQPWMETACAQGGEAEEFRQHAASGARLMRSAIQARELCKSGSAAKQAYEDYTREGLLDKIDGLESDLEAAVETAWKRGAICWTALNYPELSEKFSSRADQESPRTSKLSTKFPPSPPEPTPIITGPREWRNLYENSAGELLMTPAWYPNEEIAREHVSSDFEAHIGTVHLARATEEEPGEWIAICRADDGSLYKSGLPASREGIERCNSLCANFVGALKLSDTTGEEA